MLQIKQGLFELSSRDSFYTLKHHHLVHKKIKDISRFLCFTGELAGYLSIINNSRAFNKKILYIIIMIGLETDLFGEEFKNASISEMIDIACRFISDIKNNTEM